MIKFKWVSVITAIIALTLCLALLLVPEILFNLFSIDEHSSAFFMGRRAAVLFLGIAVITWSGRHAVHSESRQAVCLGLAIAMFALAVLGSIEYFRGFAGFGISLAVITEIILALLYYKIWSSCKHT